MTAMESAATRPRLMIASAMESAACATGPRVDRPVCATAVDWRANAKRNRADNVIVRRLRIVGRSRGCIVAPRPICSPCCATASAGGGALKLGASGANLHAPTARRLDRVSLYASFTASSYTNVTATLNSSQAQAIDWAAVARETIE